MHNGLIVIDKPQDYTSHDIVAICRKVFNQKRIGHTGTLDPLATGVLVLCLGKATRLSEYVIGLDKVYEASMVFGYATDTYDKTGKTTKSRYVHLSEELIRSTLKQFIGKQTQVPPMYSAIKVKGKKLYELAREGKNVKRAAREITIHNIEFLAFENNILKIRIYCSSGTYVRSLCHDLGIALNTFCTMLSLERISIGPFLLKDAVPIEDLKKAGVDSESYILPMERGVAHLKSYKVSKDMVLPLKNGQHIKIPTRLNESSDYEGETPIAFLLENELIGIGRIREKDGIKYAKLNKCLI